jgi:hypothetical protein
MGACSVRISGITFESSEQPFPPHTNCLLGDALSTLTSFFHVALDSDFIAQMTRRVITPLLTKAHYYAIGRESTVTRRNRRPLKAGI